MALRRWVLVAAITATCAACGSDTKKGKGGFTAGDLGNGGASGASGATGDPGAGGVISLGGLPGGGASGMGAAGSPITNLCGGHAFKAEPAPVDMYIMFDQSSSMGDPLPNTNPPSNWWAAAQQAVTNFVNDPKAAGSQAGSPAMTVGIQYFPLGGIEPQSCMADYKTPEVELGLLPGNAPAVAASIQKHQPSAFTPTSAALSGALAHMKAWAPNHLGHAPVVVLVTDGFPTECDPKDITDIAQIAKTAFDTDPKVRTFIVGFNEGPGDANAEALAVAGGTGKPFLIKGGDIGSQFVDAMLSISTTQLQCKFDLPDPPEGMKLDITQVAVTYTPSATMVEAQVPKLNGLGDCELNGNNGWFYDSPTAPSKIETCPGTCSKFAAGVVKTASGCTPVPGAVH